jgi:hypothetical protein
MNQMRRYPHKYSALLNGAMHTSYVGMLQVPKAAVNNPQAVGRRSMAKVSLLH